jgi:hypothetical protein
MSFMNYRFLLLVVLEYDQAHERKVPHGFAQLHPTSSVNFER